MIINAFHRFVWSINDGEREAVIEWLKKEIMGNQNPLVFELLEETGDTKYTNETFDKAYDVLQKAMSDDEYGINGDKLEY